MIEGTYLAIEHMSTKNSGKGGVVVNTASLAGMIEIDIIDFVAPNIALINQWNLRIRI